MRGVVAILALGLSGCSLWLDFDEDRLIDAAHDAAELPDGGDAGDVGVFDSAADVRIAVNERIRCGVSQCVVGSQVCCQTSTGASCQPAGTSCAGLTMGCDGTEDCPGEVCCGILPSGPLLCMPYGFGSSRCSGKPAENRLVICNESADCPIERPMCQQCTIQGLPIRYCTDLLTSGCTAVP